MTQAPGRWLADAGTLERLGVHAGEPVDGADFIALMEGRHPGTGRWLRPEGAGGGRGGGIDVTFSAPKSVSTVWALGDPWQREQIEQAHASAVEQTILYLREQVPVVRRRYSGRVVEEHARDVIATEYRHTTARGVSGAQAPDPQLHSHVVITGAIREDERIVAVASRPIFRNARELGAFYRSALADELVREGFGMRPLRSSNSRPWRSPTKSGPMWYSPAVLSAKLEYQSSTACPPKPAALQALLPMEPTGIEPVTSCLQSRRSPS